MFGVLMVGLIMHRPRAGLTDVLDILPNLGPHRWLISIAYCDYAGTSSIDQRFLACLYRHCMIIYLDKSGLTYDTPSKVGDYWSFFIPEISEILLLQITLRETVED